MAVHITKDGNRHDSRTVRQWPKLSDGHYWENSEPVGSMPIWREVTGKLEAEDMSPKLFGYAEAEFVAKQYRKG